MHSPVGGKNAKENKEKEEKLKLAALKKNNLARQWEKQINIDERRIDEGFTAVFFAIRSEQLAVLQVLR